MAVKTKKSNLSKTKKKVKSHTSGLKKYKTKIKELDDLLKNNEDKNIRLLAEFDNYKKRKILIMMKM